MGFHTYPDHEKDAHGLNRKIRAHALPDGQMKAAGFRMSGSGRWYMSRTLIRGRDGDDITFNIAFKGDGSDLRIDVFDGSFGQPYDYQRILEREDRPAPYAKIAYVETEKIMKELQDKGILSGHVEGGYI